MAEASAADGWHVVRLRVYYEDTDAGGVVYHANYLKFAERGRTELLRTLGGDHRALFDAHGILLQVRRCAIDYRRPARLDDTIDVATRVAELRGASVRLDQQIRRDGEVLADLDVSIVCTGADGRPKRLPAALFDAFDHAVPAPAATPAPQSAERV